MFWQTVQAQVKTEIIRENVEAIKTTNEYAGLNKQDIRLQVMLIVRGILKLLGIVFVGLIFYGGFVYFSSQGDTDQISKAKDILKTAIIGIIIVLMAYSISSLIADKLYYITNVPGYAAE